MYSSLLHFTVLTVTLTALAHRPTSKSLLFSLSSRYPKQHFFQIPLVIFSHSDLSDPFDLSTQVIHSIQQDKTSLKFPVKFDWKRVSPLGFWQSCHTVICIVNSPCMGDEMTKSWCLVWFYPFHLYSTQSKQILFTGSIHFVWAALL